MKSFWIALFASTVGIASTAGSSNAQENTRTPSVTYYGKGLNQRVDEQEYLEKSQPYSENPQYVGSQQQGRHLADMAEAKRQQYTTGYGAISEETGRARKIFVGGYTRADGKFVKPYYRSRR